MFAFAAALGFDDQVHLVRQYRLLRMHMRGLDSCRYYHVSELDRWVEHLTWREYAPVMTDDVGVAEAQATLGRLLGNVRYFELP